LDEEGEGSTRVVGGKLKNVGQKGQRVPRPKNRVRRARGREKTTVKKNFAREGKKVKTAKRAG